MDNSETLKSDFQSSLDFGDQRQQSLKQNVEDALRDYFNKIGGTVIKDLYWMVLSEIEEPLLRAVMRYTRENQSKAAVLLGLSRGTLRKKLKTYNMIK